MDLNNIKLPASTLASLYRSVLVETTSETTMPEELPVALASEKPEDEDWKSLGLNQKNILVVVYHKGLVHLPDNELSFLTGVLGACNLGIGDVAIINYNNYGETGFKEILKHYSSRIVLLFDVSPELLSLPVIFPQFQVQQNGGVQFLYAPSVAQIENDKVLKSKLWVCLRRLFNV